MAQEFIFQLQITGPERTDTYILPLGDTLVGRQEGTALMLPSRGVSRRHAQFDCDGRVCTLTDLGSANGTFVNGKQLQPNAPVTLNQGDVIQIDQFKMTFELIPIAPARPAESKPAAKKPAAKKKPPAEEPAEEKKPAAKKPAEEKPAAEKPRPPKETKAPPPAVAPPSFISAPPPEPEYDKAPPGLSMASSSYLHHLPGFFQTEFMGSFLAMFESILAPIEWNVDNFDLYLDPGTAPADFLPWLSTWFDLTLDDSWSDAQRRALLAEAHAIFARRGTRWSVSRVLEIYTGTAPEIDDLSDGLDAFTFRVSIPLRERDVNRELIERIIDANKPAHTSYELKFR